MARLVHLMFALAALFMLTVHAAKTKQDVSFALLEDEDKDEQQVQQSESIDSSDVSDASESGATDSTEWPSLRLDFKVKRKSMQVFGQSKFSIIANPVVAVHSNNVLYDAFATFKKGKTRHNYVLVNGSAYLETSSVKDKTASPTVKCLGLQDSEILLLVHSIIGMVNEASASSNDSERARISCEGNMFNVVLAGADFSVCAKESSGFSLHGSYMNVEVNYLEERTAIPIPSDEDLGCEKLIHANSVTTTGKTILTQSF